MSERFGVRVVSNNMFAEIMSGNHPNLCILILKSNITSVFEVMRVNANKKPEYVVVLLISTPVNRQRSRQRAEGRTKETIAAQYRK